MMQRDTEGLAQILDTEIPRDRTNAVIILKVWILVRCLNPNLDELGTSV